MRTGVTADRSPLGTMRASSRSPSRLKMNEKLAFGSGSGDHLCGPPVAKPEHDGMANRCTGSAALSARARSPYFPGISEWLGRQDSNLGIAGSPQVSLRMVCPGRLAHEAQCWIEGKALARLS